MRSWQFLLTASLHCSSSSSSSSSARPAGPPRAPRRAQLLMWMRQGTKRSTYCSPELPGDLGTRLCRRSCASLDACTGTGALDWAPREQRGHQAARRGRDTGHSPSPAWFWCVKSLQMLAVTMGMERQRPQMCYGDNPACPSGQRAQQKPCPRVHPVFGDSPSACPWCSWPRPAATTSQT